MNTIQQEFKDQAIFRFQEKKVHIAKCFQQLREEDIWSRPNASSNSVGNIILHLCGNIGQYVLSSLAQQPDVRERDLEFSASGGLSKEELLDKISTTIDQACAAVRACKEEELLRERQVQGFVFSGLGVILHAVEHLSYHTGQVAYLIKLRNDQQIGLYDDFDLNVKNAD
ncbi:DinB family protein [Lewinella sp. LCG006]|uniref:DinB family protein n=1 Tax=Lewinella sp. LCG006 TaxID=3231911 RepID=UPI00345F7ADA